MDLLVSVTAKLYGLIRSQSKSWICSYVYDAEKNRGKKNDFEYYVCWGFSACFVFVAFVEALYDETHIRGSERSKIKKNKK